MKRNKKSAAAAAVRKRSKKGKTDPTIDALSAVFGLVRGMEEGISAARTFAGALAILSETMDDDDPMGEVVQRLAWEVQRNCKAIEASRGMLFRISHPNRAEFQKSGWPGDEEVAAPPR